MPDSGCGTLRDTARVVMGAANRKGDGQQGG